MSSLQKEDPRPYRKNVGILVFNSAGKVLVGERLNYPGVLQFPQGGIDKGESPVDAACRELFEETGLRLKAPLLEVPDWFRYEFPEDIPERLKKYRGQEQKWFLFFWNGEVSELKLDHCDQEFKQLAWSDFGAVVDDIVEFKRDVYLALAAVASPFIKEWLARNR